MNASSTRTARHIPVASRSLITWPALVLALGLVSIARSQDTFMGGELRLTFSLQATSEVMPTGDSTCPLKLMIQGVGLTSLLGPIRDEASHCVRSDGSADHGLFTFTGATLSGPPGGGDSEDTISGQYVARLLPTLKSVLPTPTSPPGGYWLVYEAFCISKGTGKYAHIANDCPTVTKPGRSFAARGSVDLDTGQANIYGTALIHLTWE